MVTAALGVQQSLVVPTTAAAFRRWRVALVVSATVPALGGLVLALRRGEAAGVVVAFAVGLLLGLGLVAVFLVVGKRRVDRERTDGDVFVASATRWIDGNARDGVLRVNADGVHWREVRKGSEGHSISLSTGEIATADVRQSFPPVLVLVRSNGEEVDMPVTGGWGPRRAADLRCALADTVGK